MSYSAIGASPALKVQAEAAAPHCYSPSFHRCMQDAHRSDPACQKYEPFHQLYEADKDAYRGLMDDIEYCAYGWPELAVALGVGFAAGVAVVAAFS